MTITGFMYKKTSPSVCGKKMCCKTLHEWAITLIPLGSLFIKSVATQLQNPQGLSLAYPRLF